MPQQFYTSKKTWKCPHCGHAIRVSKMYARGASAGQKKHWTENMRKDLESRKKDHLTHCSGKKSNSSSGAKKVGLGGPVLLVVIAIVAFKVCSDPKDEKKSEATSEAVEQAKTSHESPDVTITTRDGKGVVFRSAPKASARTNKGLAEGSKVKPTGKTDKDDKGERWVEIEVTGSPPNKGWVRVDWLEGYE